MNGAKDQERKLAQVKLWMEMNDIQNPNHGANAKTESSGLLPCHTAEHYLELGTYLSVN